jgi:hypothetical protein
MFSNPSCQKWSNPFIFINIVRLAKMSATSFLCFHIYLYIVRLTEFIFFESVVEELLSLLFSKGDLKLGEPNYRCKPVTSIVINSVVANVAPSPVARLDLGEVVRVGRRG